MPSILNALLYARDFACLSGGRMVAGNTRRPDKIGIVFFLTNGEMNTVVVYELKVNAWVENGRSYRQRIVQRLGRWADICHNWKWSVFHYGPGLVRSWLAADEQLHVLPDGESLTCGKCRIDRVPRAMLPVTSTEPAVGVVESHVITRVWTNKYFGIRRIDTLITRTLGVSNWKSRSQKITLAIKRIQ